MGTNPSPVSPKFVSVEGADIHSRSKPDGLRFRLVSYNVLAQVYVRSSYFPHSPSPCLRAELVLEEKIDYNDLVNSIQDNKDGSTNKDSLEQSKENGNVHTDPAATNAPQNHGDPNDPCVRLKRDCIGILAAFRLKDPSHHLIVVANSQIYWDPKWADVKLAQAKYLLSRLAQFRDLVSEKFDCIPSIIVAGDFNSTPGDKVYQCLVSGDLSSTIPERECLDELPIPLRSVYASTRGEPSFTNCTPDFTDTLDYIFFCPSSDIKPVGFLELPGSDSEEVAGGLPNYYHPSDHLPIGAEFELDCSKVC
ncbi:hypothetical protein BT93_D2159 [Corymbia citriodora subsp. variegata]|nr:hypothetical protein BT93_D2159 [Corymbia citriodora subsp. variegata]